MDTYNLTWDTYSDALRDMLRELYTSSDHADMSIITEDGTHFKVHKHILSFCSPVFREILTISKEHNPIIYLRGVKQEEMEQILKFMYLGEASLQLDKTNEFLSVAASLQIKELPNNIEESQVKAESDETAPDLLTQTESSKSQDGENPVPPSNWKSLVKDRFGEGGTCKPCGKYFAGVKRHVKVKHCDIVKYECKYCEHKSSALSSLRTHVMSKHEGAKFMCDQCEFIASTPAGLYYHTNYKHLGVQFPCDKCEKKFSKNQQLKIHVDSVHFGKTYSCDLCDKKCPSKHDMLKHKARVHVPKNLQRRYPCNECDMTFTANGSVIRHKERVHKKRS